MSGKKQNSSKRRRSANQPDAAKLQEARLRRKHEDYRNQWLYTGFGIGGVLLLGCALYGFVNAGSVVGGDLHKSVAAETEHCQVSAAMLAYYFQEHADSYLAYAASDSSAAAFNPEQPLDQQYYDAESQTTWYSFLMSNTMNTVQNTLKTCEAAYAAGYTLPEDVQAEIEKDADETDLSHYLSGVTREDVAQVMTMQMIARYYPEEAGREIAVTDAEIEAEAKANPESYEMFSMLCFTFGWEEGDTAGEQAARDHAQALADTVGTAEYEAYARDYMENEEQLPAESIERRLIAMRMTSGYSSYTDEVQTWIRSAKPGETYLLESPQLHYIEVLRLETEPKLDDSDCVDLRVIYLAPAEGETIDDTRRLAQNLMQQCKDAGGTPESFASLAAQYSKNSVLAASGGLVEGYSRIRTTYGAETAEWAFESGRRQGDMFLCERDAAVILAYYQGENARCGWENQVSAALLKQKNDALSAKLTGSEVRTDEKVQKLIPARVQVSAA